MTMKHRVFPIVSALAALAFATAATSALAAAAGQTAPDFTLTDTHGKAVRLSDYRGKYVVLEWTNPDCPFVQRHYNTRNMPGLQKEWGTRDVTWLSIDSSSRDSGEFKTGAQLDAWMNAHEGSQKAVLIDGDSAGPAAARDSSDGRSAPATSGARSTWATAVTRQRGQAATATTSTSVPAAPTSRTNQSSVTPGWGSANRAVPIGVNSEAATATAPASAAATTPMAVARIIPRAQS